MAHKIEQQGGRNLEHVEKPVGKGDAGPTTSARRHLNRDLLHAEPTAEQQHDHFRFGIILGVPVGERVDYLAVDCPESRGAIGHSLAGEQPEKQWMRILSPFSAIDRDGLRSL